MAQGDLVVFEEFVQDLCGGVFNLQTGGDTIKIALITDAVTAIAATATPRLADFTQVTGGNGYTTGGETLGNIVGAEAGGVFTFDDTGTPSASWTQNGSGPTDIFQAIIYSSTAAADQAIAFVDMTADSGTTPISLQDGDITWTPNASGIFTLTVS